VLKRLEDALRDGDTIHAVIKGAALNNDGSHKAGYTAPAVNSQSEVIAMAQALAAVDPESISYVEAHGTATPLGDPIEIAALTKAFRLGTSRSGFCAIGSVKTNIGHLDAAAGVAGLIKTVLALEHGLIPPSLHFEAPNPKIDFSSSPFYVNSKATAWQRGAIPRRAGVSSFGIGGTNAHVVWKKRHRPSRANPISPGICCYSQPTPVVRWKRLLIIWLVSWNHIRKSNSATSPTLCRSDALYLITGALCSAAIEKKPSNQSELSIMSVSHHVFRRRCTVRSHSCFRDKARNTPEWDRSSIAASPYSAAMWIVVPICSRNHWEKICETCWTNTRSSTKHASLNRRFS